MIAFRPAALSLRFLRANAVDEAAPDCSLAAAHLFRWAAAILVRAAEDILRLSFATGALPSVAPGLNIWRNSAIRALSRFFLFLETINGGDEDFGVAFCRHAS
jgi:hypothetical protein